MLEDYTRYLVSIRDSLIQCGVSFPVTPIESYMDVLDLGAKLDSVLWYYSMLEISGSRKSLRGFLLPLGRCYLFEMRRRAYEEYKGIIATYDKLRVKPEKKVKSLENGSSTQENMVYLLQYIGHGRYVEDIVGDRHIEDAEQPSSSVEENRELAEFLYGSDSYSSAGRYVEDVVNSRDSIKVDENGFEEPEESSSSTDTEDFLKQMFKELSGGVVEDKLVGNEVTEHMVDENGFEIEPEPETHLSYSEPEVDEYGFEIEPEPMVDENGFEVEDDSYGDVTPEPMVDEYGFEISDEPESVPYVDGEDSTPEPEVDEYGFEISDEPESIPYDDDEEYAPDEPKVDENGFEIEDEPESIPYDEDEEEVSDEPMVDEYGFEITDDEPKVDEYGFELPDESTPVTQGSSSNDILDRLKETGTSVSEPVVPVKDFSDTLQEKTNEILTKGKRAVIRGIRRLEK